VLVVLDEDRRDQRDEVGLLIANEALGAAKKGFFMLLGSDHL